jgi:hypothetical protein
VTPPRPGPPPAVDRAFSAVARQTRERTLRTWVGTERSDSGKTRVTFVWEPVAATPGVTQDPPARVALTATNSDGTPYFRGRVPDALMASTTAATSAPPGGVSTTPAPWRVVFDAAPGRMQVKMSIEGERGQVLSTETQEMAIPDFTTMQVALSTPVVLRARNAVDLRTILKDPAAVPHAGREFRRTDRLVVRFAAYGPGTGQPAATARLLNRGGQPMSDLPVAPSGTPGGSQVDLPLAGLAAGEYLIEIKAKGAEAEATELVAFKVTS